MMALLCFCAEYGAKIRCKRSCLLHFFEKNYVRKGLETAFSAYFCHIFAQKKAVFRKKFAAFGEKSTVFLKKSIVRRKKSIIRRRKYAIAALLGAVSGVRRMRCTRARAGNFKTGAFSEGVKNQSVTKMGVFVTL
ncbi:MAG: hypothetical protein Q4E63_06380 [Prevotellaceae bacterium]|nr:hypothetical protein [Prevotellaceae bacterium]